MQNELIKQGIEWNKLILESFKNFTGTNVNSRDKILAELGQDYISLLKELGGVYTDSINELLQTQLKLVNLDVTSESFKELGDIYVSSMTKLGEKQAELIRLYIETTAKYSEILKGAKKLDDIVNVQASMFIELQEKLKNNMMETMNVFNSINSAMEIVTKKNLEAFAAGDSEQN